MADAVGLALGFAPRDRVFSVLLGVATGAWGSSCFAHRLVEVAAGSIVDGVGSFSVLHLVEDGTLEELGECGEVGELSDIES